MSHNLKVILENKTCIIIYNHFGSTLLFKCKNVSASTLKCERWCVIVNCFELVAVFRFVTLFTGSNGLTFHTESCSYTIGALHTFTDKFFVNTVLTMHDNSVMEIILGQARSQTKFVRFVISMIFPKFGDIRKLTRSDLR